VLGVAVSVTVPEKLAEHVEPPEPQFIPAGLDVTFPFVGIGLIDKTYSAAKSGVSLATKASERRPLQLLQLACAPPAVLGKLSDKVHPAT
jgi:hypothetical protein